MATFILILICLGILVGTGAYIALMNSVWFKNKSDDSAPGEKLPPR